MTQAPPPCPNCGTTSVPEHRPFCSRHCADVDLGRWLSESYVFTDEEPAAPPSPKEETEHEKPG